MAILPIGIKAFTQCKEGPFPLGVVSFHILEYIEPLRINFLLPCICTKHCLSTEFFPSRRRAEEYYHNPVTRGITVVNLYQLGPLTIDFTENSGVWGACGPNTVTGLQTRWSYYLSEHARGSHMIRI